MLDFIAIGSRIRSARELLGISRDELAENINVSPRFIYDIELGNKGMSIDTLARISEALNISTDYILYGSVKSKEEALCTQLDPSLLSLIIRCPAQQREHLYTIIQHYVFAVSDCSTNHEKI